MRLPSETRQDVMLDTNRDENDDISSSHETSPKDDQGSSSNASGTNSKSESNRTGTTDDEVTMIKEELTRIETKNVFRLRIVVITILVTVAMAMAFTIYYITRKAELEAFDTEFEGVAEAIITSLNGKYKDMQDARYASDCITVTIPLTSSFISSTFRHLRSLGCGCWSRCNNIR